MIVRKKEETKPTKLTEDHAISCIASYFEWFRNLCFPNVYMCGGEMDVAVLTPANYLWEIEVKLSLSDWKADEHKDKWKPSYYKQREEVSRFYYAVPTKLINKVPDFVSAEAGLIEIYWDNYWGYRIKVVRESKWKRGKKIIERRKDHLLRKIYFKYWAKRMKEKRQ